MVLEIPYQELMAAKVMLKAIGDVLIPIAIMFLINRIRIVIYIKKKDDGRTHKGTKE